MSFLKKLAKAAGKVVTAPVHVTAKVAASPFKITAKVTGVKAIGKLGNTVSSVTKNPFKPVAKAAKTVSKTVRKVPVVGKPLSAVVNLGTAPVRLVSKVAEGERIDKAALEHIKSQVKSVKEIAPYAKMCVSLIPGVGTAVAAGIAAGSALVEGQPISDALIAGVKGAIPGGFVAQGAFTVSCDVLQGKSLNTAAINALPLNNNQKSALKTVISMTKDLAAGKNVAKTVIANAQKQLPTDVQKAVNIGIALGFGKSHQKKAIAKPAPITVKGKPAPAKVQQLFSIPKTVSRKPSTQTPAEKMQIEGKTIVDKDPVLKAGDGTLKSSNDKHGYYAAIGMMSHTASEAEISKFHSTLPKTDENGFNIGCAVVVGLKQIKRTGDNLKDFGSAVALGLNGASNNLKVKAVQTVAVNPQVREAVLEVAATKKISWIKKLFIKLGFIKQAA